MNFTPITIRSNELVSGDIKISDLKKAIAEGRARIVDGHHRFHAADPDWTIKIEVVK